MNIEEGYLYHIYNHGNNQRKVFFNRDNYLFFLKKVNQYILPYADILAWCLMPNHFHFMLYINKTEIEIFSDTMTQSHRITKKRTLTQSHRITKKRTFNDAFGIMLRSYTRAINKKNKLSGSLFKAHTQAINLNKPQGITATWYKLLGITVINVSNPEKEYPNVCYNYILENPVKAGLVKKTVDWEFSSARDAAGLRNGKLINKKQIKLLLK